MNVEVKETDFTKIFLVKKLFGDRNEPKNTNNTDPTVIGFSVAGCAVILTIVVVLICICRRRKIRRRKLGERTVVSTSTTTTTCPSVYVVPAKVELRTTEDVTRRYQRSVSNLSAKSQIYLVPFDVLPPNFDFASREVQVKSDYVILKDLSLLQRFPSNPSNGIVNEAYETQEPYNPNISNGWSSRGLVGEEYQKQSPYNPTFY